MMNVAGDLMAARRRAGLTQREVAARAGMAQSEVARIETGVVLPRVDTLDRLLAACGQELQTRPRLGLGVDRSAIRELLALTPAQRARLAAAEANNLGVIARRG
jgi:transcriptional regulator with XRE-family HTH domain